MLKSTFENYQSVYEMLGDEESSRPDARGLVCSNTSDWATLLPSMYASSRRQGRRFYQKNRQGQCSIKTGKKIYNFVTRPRKIFPAPPESGEAEKGAPAAARPTPTYRSSASWTGVSSGSAGAPVQLPWGSVLADCQAVRSMAFSMGLLSRFFSMPLPPSSRIVRAGSSMPLFGGDLCRHGRALAHNQLHALHPLHLHQLPRGDHPAVGAAGGPGLAIRVHSAGGGGVVDGLGHLRLPP